MFVNDKKIIWNITQHFYRSTYDKVILTNLSDTMHSTYFTHKLSAKYNVSISVKHQTIVICFARMFVNGESITSLLLDNASIPVVHFLNVMWLYKPIPLNKSYVESVTSLARFSTRISYLRNHKGCQVWNRFTWISF